MAARQSVRTTTNGGAKHTHLTSIAEEAESFLRCQVCRGEFTDPKLLPCLHTFCQECLETSLRQSGIGPGNAFLCPLCKTQCFVPLRGVAGFKDNIFYLTLQEFCDRRDMSPDQACEACDSGHLAKRQCIQCNDWLCSKCCSMHQKVKVTRDHHLLSPQQLKSGEFDDLIKESFDPLMCDRHGEPLKLYCTNPACSAPICTVCKTTLGHDNHIAIELTAQAVRQGKELAALMPNMERSIACAKNKLDNLKHEEKVISQVRKKTHKVINDRVEEITRMVTQQINQYAENMRQEVDKMVKEHKKEVKDELEDISTKLLSMEQAKSFSDSLLSFNRAEELVAMYAEVEKRLKEYQKPPDIHPPGWRQPRLHPPEQIEQEVIANIFGTLTFEGEVIKTSMLRSIPTKLDDDERNPALCDITLDEADNMLVLDRDNRRIKIFDHKGHFLTHTGEEYLRAPNRLLHLKQTGRLLIKDEKYLRLFNIDGTFVANFAEHLKQPVGLAQNYDNQVLVADWMSGEVHVFDELGTRLNKFSCACEAPGYLAATPDGKVVISDWKQHTVRIFDQKGGLLKQYGEYGSGEGQLDHPYGVCTDKYGHILIADTWNNRIHMITSDGHFIRFLLTRDDGIQFPQTLSVNSRGQMIIVEQQGLLKVCQYMA